jgi:hypothetical protein
MKRSTFLKACVGFSALALFGNLGQIERPRNKSKFTRVLTVHFPEGKDFDAYWNDRKTFLRNEAVYDYTSRCMKDKTITDFKKVIGKNHVEYHYSFSSAEAEQRFSQNLIVQAQCDVNLRSKLGYKVTSLLLG